MYEAWAYALASVAAVSGLSLVGALALLLGGGPERATLLCLVGFSAGGLLGGAFFHLIPEAIEASGFPAEASLYIILGILTSLLVEKGLRWRGRRADVGGGPPRSFAYVNLFGDAVHNMLDGMAIGVAYLVSPSTGLATTLAVFFHELPQEIGDFGVLIYSGLGRRRALAYNFLTALTALVGAVLALLLSSYVEGLELFLVPFAAGGFVYLAGTDLIPELLAEERPNQSALQMAAMVLGILILFYLKKTG